MIDRELARRSIRAASPAPCDARGAGGDATSARAHLGAPADGPARRRASAPPSPSSTSIPTARRRGRRRLLLAAPRPPTSFASAARSRAAAPRISASLAPVPPRLARERTVTTRIGAARAAPLALPFRRRSGAGGSARRGVPWRLAVGRAGDDGALRATRRSRPTCRSSCRSRSTAAPRGEHGPVLGNYLALSFRALPTAGRRRHRRTLARALRDQLAEAVRRDELEATWAGMSFARYRPLRGMFRELPWTRGGDFCSFHFADTGRATARPHPSFGARIVGGYHVAAVPARPGVGVFFSRARRDREPGASAGADDVLDDADAGERRRRRPARDEMGSALRGDVVGDQRRWRTDRAR